MKILSEDSGILLMARRISAIEVIQKYIYDVTLWHNLQLEKDKLVVELNELAKEIGEEI